MTPTDELRAKLDELGNATNAALDDKIKRLTLVGFEKCQECGYEYAEIWKDNNTESKYVRCPHFNCGNSGKLIQK